MNIIIVDDELQIQNWLKLLLQKTEFPAKLMGMFSNGVEAYDFCMDNNVDLVITDIRMPLMDGLRLIQQLKSRKPSTRFLILSAHEEFHYASEGMRLGASDYLLKAEITIDELRDALHRIRIDLNNETKLGNEMKHMRMALNENQQALRNVYLKELIHSAPNAIGKFAQKKAQIGLNIDPKGTIMLAIGFPSKEFELKNSHFQSRDLLELAIVNVTEETLAAEYGRGNAFPVDTALFAVILNCPSSGRKSVHESILHYANRISSNLWNYLKFHASIGISELYGDIAELKHRWSEASQALSQNLFYGRQAIVSYQDMLVDSSLRTRDTLVAEWHGNVVRQLEIDYFDGVQEEIHVLLREIEAKKHLSATQVKAVMLEIVYSLRRKLQSLSIPAGDESAVLDIHSISTFQECKDWLLTHLHAFMEAILHKKRSPAIAQICSYIASNYAQNISLPEAASLVHLNKTYLSGLFKKEMGVNFNDYLTNYRLDKAKELLLTNRCNISELAEKVGYSNSSHFAKVFKKTTGLSPLEYKKSMHGGKS